MKRGAEKQLSKDDQLSDEETEDVSDTFKKADESTLAGRKLIRSLPKRAVAGSAVAASNGTSTLEPPVTIPKFSGFSGFGTASNNNAFTFAATTAKPASLTSQASLELQPQPTAAPIASPASTAVSTTATTTARTLASFLGAPPDASAGQKLASTGPATSLAFPLFKSPPTTAPTSSILPPSLPKAEAATTANDSAVKYYTDLRGLNVSLISALSKATLDDPFIDFVQFLEQYKSQRWTIQSRYDKSNKSETNVNETDKTDTSKPKNPPSMPAPPSSFLFGNKPFGAPSSKVGETNGGGFKPTSPTTADASPFRFPSSTSTSPSETSNDASSSKPASSSFFGFGTSTSVAVTSAFGSSAKPDVSNPFKLPPSSSSTTTVGATAPIFGAPTAFPSTPTSSPFTKPPSTAAAFGPFGKPSGSGSIGNPVGFGFGANASGSKEANNDKPTPPSGFTFAQPSSSVFGALAPAKKTEDGEGEGEEVNAGGDTSTAEGDDSAKAGSSSALPHDGEGEGEEDEETTHSARVKAYRMRKEGERGGPGWAELGVGYLRLKRHKESNARRMLLRNSSTGKININFKIYAGLKVSSRAKKELTFIGHDSEGISQTYSIRLPNEDQVHELKEAIEREVALVKPTER